jgi:hypothetical protein
VIIVVSLFGKYISKQGQQFQLFAISLVGHCFVRFCWYGHYGVANASFSDFFGLIFYAFVDCEACLLKIDTMVGSRMQECHTWQVFWHNFIHELR